MEGSPRLARSLLNTIGFCIKNLLELLKEIYCCLFVYSSLLLYGSVMLDFCLFFFKLCSVLNKYLSTPCFPFLLIQYFEVKFQFF